MSTQTPNLGLTKPAGNERPQVSVINGNSDILDNALAFLSAPPEISHRNLFRGKYLGSSVSADQWAAIDDGTFTDLYVGDYWTTSVTIGGTTSNVNWRIADINYWCNMGDTSFTTNHLVIVPDTILYSAKMNDTNTTDGGYVGSKMHTTNLADAKTAINSIFGSSHVLSHREYMSDAVTNGKPSRNAWVDSTVEIMTECMVYGHLHFSPTSDGTTIPTVQSIDKTQLALFNLAPQYINIRSDYWLREVVSNVLFARTATDGFADRYGAMYDNGVRPCFAIGTAPSA